MYYEFRGKRYQTKQRKDKFIITSKTKISGFINYIDILGNEHTDLFMKIIEPDKLSHIYKQKIYLSYKETYFELFAEDIRKSDVERDSFLICTNSEGQASEFGFEKKEQFVFLKEISRKDIEALKIVRICPFEKESHEHIKIMKGNEIDEYLAIAI